MRLKKIINGSTLAEDVRTILSNSINIITLNCEIKLTKYWYRIDSMVQYIMAYRMVP
jgi:hypothetical protein